MAAVDENVHALTLKWWESLPWCYQKEDARQGFNVGPPWQGLNRDPRFVTGFDSWTRTNTSTRPWEASVAFSRRFPVEPGAPVLVRSWHTPAPLESLTDTTAELGDAVLGLMRLGETTTTVRVRHVLRNHTGTIVSEQTTDLAGDPAQTVDTWWTPDRFGVLHATVEVTVNVPGFMDALNAIHVGHREVTFEELPDATSFRIARPYPLLRFMDGVGFQAGIVSDTVEQMHDGGWTDPATAPEIALPYLAAVLGLPSDYAETLTAPVLREHLVGLVDGGTPSAGTTAAVAAVAKQYLTGDKQVSVLPGVTPGAYPSAAERDLLAAMGQPGAVYLQPDPPASPSTVVAWAGAAHASASTWTVDGTLKYENLVPNPSFETGVGGWLMVRGNITQDTSRAYLGASSARLDATGTNPYIYSDAIPAPSRVTLRFRVYTEQDGARVAPYVWLYDQDGNNLPAPTPAQTPLTPGRWHTLEHTIDTSAATTLRASVRLPAEGTTVWVDNVSVSRPHLTHPDYFDGSTTPPGQSITRDVWVDSDTGVPHTFNTTTRNWDPATTHTTLGQQVVNTHEGHLFTAAHTLILLVRPDEVPNSDVAAFQDFLNTSGVAPAGHQVLARAATPTWGQWQEHVGDTWSTMHARAPRWVDHHSAGIDLGD